MAITFSGVVPGAGGGNTYTANEGISIDPNDQFNIQLGEDGSDPNFPGAITGSRYIALQQAEFNIGVRGDVNNSLGDINLTIAARPANPFSFNLMLMDLATGIDKVSMSVGYFGITNIIYDAAGNSKTSLELLENGIQIAEPDTGLNVLASDRVLSTLDTDYILRLSQGPAGAGLVFPDFPGSSGRWQLGDLEQNGPYTLVPSECLLVEVGGTIYRLGLVTV